MALVKSLRIADQFVNKTCLQKHLHRSNYEHVSPGSTDLFLYLKYLKVFLKQF
jgi:hypothetical protein